MQTMFFGPAVVLAVDTELVDVVVVGGDRLDGSTTVMVPYMELGCTTQK